MNRRDLLKGSALFPVLASSTWSQNRPTPPASTTLLKPKRLAHGDTIGVIAPSSGLKPDAFDRAVRKLESLGFKTKVGKFARENRGLFSGTEVERLHDLHWAFGDPEIRAVWCVRGGDGAPRLLPDLDYELIRRNPKILIGYSDITALHLAIYQKCGLVMFHGPVGSSSFSDYAKEHVLNLLMNPTAPYRLEGSDANRANPSDLYRTAVVTSGKARGRLIGGNLSLLTALAGTPWALQQPQGKILFFEDVDEEPYRIDRMLTQLRQSVDLRALAGVAVGVLSGCVAKEGKPSPSVLEVVNERLGDLGIPVIYGLSFGHIKDQFTLPIGIEAELDTATASLTLLEPSVV
ncbi:MAG: LD-carboxypeptidase [Opitutaceae bacterium]